VRHLIRAQGVLPATAGRLACGLAACLCLWSGSALASDSLGVLAIAEPPGPGLDLARLTDELRTVLAEQDADVVDTAQLRERMEGKPADASLAELDRAYRGALAAYAAGEMDSAVETLRTVLASLDRLPESEEVLSRWTPAMIRLARAEQALGHRRRAASVLEQLLRGDPGFAIDPVGSIAFAGLVQEVRDHVHALGTHRLTVRAPAPSQVFVDGREEGTTPVTLELPPGDHRIAGRCGGIRVPAMAVDLSRDQAVDLDTSFVEAQRPDAGPGLACPAAEWPDRIIATASHLHLSRVIMTSLLRVGGVVTLVATLHDVRRGTVEREGRIRLVDSMPGPGSVEALAEFMLTGERSPLLISPPPRAALVATPAPIPALVTRSEETAHRHLGFYFRLGLNFGYTRSEPTNSAGPLVIDGSRGGLEASIGGAAVEDLILAAHVWTTGIFEDPRAHQTLLAAGPEFTYYLMPANVYLSLTLAVTSLNLRSASATYTTDAGYGGMFVLGKEWWMSDHWGLGLAGQFAAAINPEGQSGGLAWMTYSTSLALSATYN
jgi:hypothetical protein